MKRIRRSENSVIMRLDHSSRLTTPYHRPDRQRKQAFINMNIKRRGYRASVGGLYYLNE